VATTDSDIVNRAIALVGIVSQPISGSIGSFTPAAEKAAVAANYLYPSVVQTVARQYGYDFSRNVAALVTTGNTPPIGWTFEYAYPTNGIEVRQVIPPSVTDANNPTPVRWTVGNHAGTASFTKVIWSNTTTASAVFTNQPTPDLWDAGFTEAVVRLLGSEMAMALAGKPETSKMTFETEQMFEQSAQTREG
jgi:hypothetical protein